MHNFARRARKRIAKSLEFYGKEAADGVPSRIPIPFQAAQEPVRLRSNPRRIGRNAGGTADSPPACHRHPYPGHGNGDHPTRRGRRWRGHPGRTRTRHPPYSGSRRSSDTSTALRGRTARARARLPGHLCPRGCGDALAIPGCGFPRDHGAEHPYAAVPAALRSRRTLQRPGQRRCRGHRRRTDVRGYLCGSPGQIGGQNGRLLRFNMVLGTANALGTRGLVRNHTSAPARPVPARAGRRGSKPRRFIFYILYYLFPATPAPAVGVEQMPP